MRRVIRAKTGAGSFCRLRGKRKREEKRSGMSWGRMSNGTTQTCFGSSKCAKWSMTVGVETQWTTKS